jgi:hypothetical protein
VSRDLRKQAKRIDDDLARITRRVDAAQADADAARQRELVTICEWFALCDHAATGTMTHPILGEVPICDRCRAKVESL